MKKGLIIASVVGVLLIGFMVSIPLVNNLSARKVEEQLIEVALPEDTELIESLSHAGKLAGNGNGMQFFGAILLKSGQSLEELSAYYGEKLPGAVVKEQDSREISAAEHEELSFQAEITAGEAYYIVYMFGSGSHPFADLDLRGH